MLFLCGAKVLKKWRMAKGERRKDFIFIVNRHFFTKKRARTCVCEKKVVSLHAILDEYAILAKENANNFNCYRACRGGDAAAECGSDMPQRPLV